MAGNPPHTTIRMRFATILITLIFGFALFGIASMMAMKKLNVNGDIYHRIADGKELMIDIAPPPEYIVESYAVALELMMQTNSEAEIDQLIQNFDKLKVNYEARHDFWKNHGQNLNQEVKTKVLNTASKAALAFYSLAQEQFIPSIKARNYELAAQSLAKMHESYQEHRTVIEQAAELARVENEKEEINAQVLIEKYDIGLLTIFIFSVGIASLLTSIISRSIVRELGAEPFEVIELAKNVAQGNYHSVHIRGDNSNSLMSHMKKMQFKLFERTAAANNLKNEILRVKIALDNVNTGVMITDNNLEIVYVNKSVLNTLKENEKAIHAQLPRFDSKNLVGAIIDDFHKNPDYQRDMLKNLKERYRATMEIGGRNMVVFATPVVDENGERLGTVAEWHDRTAEAAVEKEVAEIVAAAGQGDLSKRLNIEDKEGLLRDLGNGINQLMHTNETSLAEIARVLKALSHGDLTQKITNEYAGTFGELKNDANTTVEKITEIVYQIKDASDSINSGAKEIAAGNNDLSRRTEDQAHSLEETASSMTELTSTVQHNAENAKYANQLASDATKIAEKGSSVVGQVVHTMDCINESSRKVVEIISVIDNIAFQTNILALNAAVEAARAGEQGRGFAVVATEVRNLAQRAAAAAGEIQTLIGNSVDKVQGGSELVAQAGATMKEIVQSIQGVTNVMSEITSASLEQSQGISQVNHAITQMDEVTQQNAALVEQAAASAESLEEQARKLSVTVANFKTN